MRFRKLSLDGKGNRAHNVGITPFRGLWLRLDPLTGRTRPSVGDCVLDVLLDAICLSCNVFDTKGTWAPRTDLLNVPQQTLSMGKE